MILSFDVIH